MDKDESIQLPQFSELEKKARRESLESLFEKSHDIGKSITDHSYNETHCQNFYALIRHGERADNIDL